ncbi:MAG: biotin--[acetyl-CoA-carboxylase] ligase [Pirellulaceae bacterium]|nr:biotin--[acetyl-CoA-carboxylase] ligase [Pirellulaceae bacterium]
MMTSVFDLDRIQAETFVDEIKFRAELPSTNDLALTMARDEDVRLPLLVLAERQTCGRGRGTNRWWSADGALTFSLVLDITSSSLGAERLPQISLTSALSVCEALQHLEPTLDVGLKWPNDIYVQQRKICGILIEVPSRPTGRMVVGVGLNVNNSLADAPEELCHSAISLCDATGHNADLDDVLIAILRVFSGHLRLLEANPKRLQARWQELSILTGCTVLLDVGRQEVRGVCQGIDADGGLLLKTDQGVQRILSGVIREFR